MRTGHDRGVHVGGRIRLDIDDHVAIVTNDHDAKHNAFDDAMDLELFAVLAELRERPEVRAVVWRGEGRSFSSGRDVGSIGTGSEDLSHHELMRRGHRGIQQLWDLDAPVLVACKGWVMGGSFQRALLCDVRVAAEGTRFRLPELTHGVIPDTGGVAVLHQICGPGVVSDLVLTGRVMEVDEAHALGIVSRVVAPDRLDDEVLEMAHQVASRPTVSVKLARQVIRHLSLPQVRASMDDELVYQTTVNRSDDFAEFRAARAEGREPRFRGC
jgi:enoyl-CoA hydratase/carnithine racemase